MHLEQENKTHLRLPTEILSEIVELAPLGRDDVVSLCLASRVFHALAVDKLYRTISLKNMADSPELGVDYLHYRVARLCETLLEDPVKAHWVQTLEIRDLDAFLPSLPGTFMLLQHTIVRLPNLTKLHLADQFAQARSFHSPMPKVWIQFLFSLSTTPTLRKFTLAMCHIEPVVAYNVISQHPWLREIDLFGVSSGPMKYPTIEFPQSRFRIHNLENFRAPLRWLLDVPSVDTLSTLYLYGDLVSKGFSQSGFFLNKLQEFTGLTSLSLEYREFPQVTNGAILDHLGQFVPRLCELEIRVRSCVCNHPMRTTHIEGLVHRVLPNFEALRTYTCVVAAPHFLRYSRHESAHGRQPKEIGDACMTLRRCTDLHWQDSRSLDHILQSWVVGGKEWALMDE